ncbi:MAG: 3-deoxy-D-manno-octulosonate 8-phosphate phosphatase KdsC [Lentisphaerae bacterium ADurb.Bin082]|nr:MAG: 3-deoxy-D-manno-octulosonate 8-phosphate phosphatase KdsC [Lentisphaerae bacterium ADurb.Bin082]
MIKAVILDIDGVLTNGKVTVDSEGRESKAVDFKDIDAVFEMKRRGIKVGLVTGEATPITLFFKERFKPDFFYNGCKDKPRALAEIMAQTGYAGSEICYVGDAKYDIPVMKLVKYSACPANAISEVKALASIQLERNGGDGCIWELMERLNLRSTVGVSSFACKSCGALCTQPPVLDYPGQPAGAQHLPVPENADQDKPFDLSVFQCVSCGLVQLNAAPVPYYREVIRAAAVSAEMAAFRTEQFAEFVQKHNLVGKKVLECGCGAGEFLPFMEQAGAVVTGMEYGENNVKKARAAGFQVERLFFDTGAERLQSGPFDAFYILNYLEHIPDLRACLAGIRGNLAPGAVGLIEVPNFEMLLARGMFMEFMRDHLYYFTVKSLSLLLETNGFEVLSAQSVFHDYVLSLQVRLRPPTGFSAFAVAQQHLTGKLNALVEQYGGCRTAFWGASHQAFALLAFAGLHDKIKCIIDSAPFKQGCLSPATHIPIVAPDSLQPSEFDLLIVAAGGYSEEVARLARERFGTMTVIYILREHKLEPYQG